MKSKNSAELFGKIIGMAIVLVASTITLIFVAAIVWKIFMWIVSL